MQNLVLQESRIDTNYLSFIKRLEAYNAYSDDMFKDLGDKLKNGTFYIREETGGCYVGSLIDIILNHLCKIAYNINEFAFGGEKKNHPILCVNKEKLIKVLLLQHISKAELYVPETDDWRIKKGMLFTFNNDNLTRMKVGERSAYICQKYGIKLEEDEYEALISIDDDEEKNDMFSSPLTCLVKAVNNFTSVEIRQRYFQKCLLEKEKNKLEE